MKTITGFEDAQLILDPVPDFTPTERGIVLICPGGGYCWLSGREDAPIARAFARYGYRSAFLWYTVDQEPLLLKPVREAAWAVNKLRELYPGEPVYLLGFSAGAHCAASVCVRNGAPDWNGRPVFDPVKVDRLMLAYPVITGGPFAHEGSFRTLLGDPAGWDPEEYARARRWFSLETDIPSSMPPVFLWQTQQDNSVPVQNSLLLAENLIASGVPVEYHLYPKGIHGLSLATDEVQEPEKDRMSDPHVARWFDLMIDWLRYPLP